MSEPLYASVFPLLRTQALTSAFDYAVPEELRERVVRGSLVAVPLGAQTAIGVVLGVATTVAYEGRIVVLYDVLDVPALPTELLDLASRVEEFYLISFAHALALVAPPSAALKVVRRYELTDEGRRARQAGEEGLDEALLAGGGVAGELRRMAERGRRRGWLRRRYEVRLVAGAAPGRVLRLGAADAKRLGARQRAALELVAAAGALDERALRTASGITAAGLNSLLAAGALVADSAGSDVGLEYAWAAPATTVAPPPELLPEQRAAIAAVSALPPGGEALLHGVTGSGKTEVYLRLAAEELAAGRSALFLVPEIGLTSQTVTRLRERFAGEPVVVLHSALAAGERLAAYRALAEGRARLAVGARSAIFAPLRGLGLIVIDEEHDASYKQEGEPAYDARTVARWRAAASGARLLFGSATPSVESYRDAGRRIVLSRRVDGSLPPRLEIVDMRSQHGVFSTELVSALAATVDAGKKAMLFINRRGSAAFLLCDQCGHSWECPACDVGLAYYRSGDLRCRVCGYHEKAPAACPECGGLDLVRLGVGTERVEQEVAALLPGVDVQRLDSDVAGSQARLRRVLERFAADGPRILVGTQLIAKGHHFPEVTLVGVIDADLTLHFSDFRAEEATFSLLLQVGGRSGRGSVPGRVLVQTLSPEARPIVAAAAGDVDAFYREELIRRRELDYPPATTLIAFEVSAPEVEKVMLAARFTADQLRARLTAGEAVLGPSPSWRRHNRSLSRVVVKSVAIGETLDTIRPWLKRNRPRFADRGVRLIADVEPRVL